jgi:hypothetical protein
MTWAIYTPSTHPFEVAGLCGSAEECKAPRRLLTMYFGTPNMFITLWFGLDYEINPPLGTLMI